MPSKKASPHVVPHPLERFKSTELFEGQITITMWRYYSGEVSYIAGGMKRSITDVPPANPVFALPSKEEYDAMSEAERSSGMPSTRRSTRCARITTRSCRSCRIWWTSSST